ncbi:uncharacterized protein K452DRAFT_236344 [Aplosporella prunicola CBS 121167]|uniref:ABC transporter domain-containing protein n=1 Tax=Aplosporella prunicola CBS 121167 TaxID=1176127 RepID=A0A6A6AZE0_9PEZI|nr:uncharacterized protein K452DRAFT_236344 [Aplosporella prunicola CBS 121167]KAF2137150.1 hypothetical protein K452DRAFT_236344 [Aplosporella prunicola CBS 121167]
MRVRYLAQRYSTISPLGDDGQNPFSAAPHPLIDPRSPLFQARAWAKALVNLRAEEADLLPERTAGVGFGKLEVCASGGGSGGCVGRLLLLRGAVGAARRREKTVLQGFDGVVESGELLLVLGPPGAGCSTLLKAIAGELHGLRLDQQSYINYQGICADQMHDEFRGQAMYTSGATEAHTAALSVGDTLAFAARTRAPRRLVGGVARERWVQHMRDVAMAMFSVSDFADARVDSVGAAVRRRVGIAEATLSRAPLQCWDECTRGLSAADALEFCRSLRVQADLMGATACVSLYQASQAAYDVFDKVTLLYEGQQIFFGRVDEARDFFVAMGFECAPRQSTADFLTGLTSPAERRVRPGFQCIVPRTPDDFVRVWRASEEYRRLLRDIKEYHGKYAIGGDHLHSFALSKRAQQARLTRAKSPYTLSYAQQVWLCLWRCAKCSRTDARRISMQTFGYAVVSVILGSVFYNLPPGTESFYQRGALLFFAILACVLSSSLEIQAVYALRPVVEKHARHALYHPSAEALASTIAIMPRRALEVLVFTVPFYFMANLRREPGAFLFLLLISFFLSLTLALLFRSVASISRTPSQATVLAILLALSMIIFSGLPLPVPHMRGWIRWTNYLDPVAYAFEALMVNEFDGKKFACEAFVPDYPDAKGDNRVCLAVGAVEGADTVKGDAFVKAAFQYFPAHQWSCFYILVGYAFFFLLVYLLSTEFVRAKKPKGEILVFQRGHAPHPVSDDIEISALRSPQKRRDSATASVIPQTPTFHWQDLCYNIKTKNGQRRVLDDVDGWVKAGSLTAIMGVSEAAKTALLDFLADRVTIGVVSGEVMMDGLPRNKNFQYTMGYVQQQDLHPPTSTVREALNFSALMRRPAHVPKKEKLEYVSEVLNLLDMENYADAFIGFPGEGLNTSQRRRLTIAIELVAKPTLLLVDDPTSSLDAQTAWTICTALEQLSNSGQAVLCALHQAPAPLLSRFDRLLLLAADGKPVYCGDTGPGCASVIKYFEERGASPCPEAANPAEWLLQVASASVPGAGAGGAPDAAGFWPQAWKDSGEARVLREELRRLGELPLRRCVLDVDAAGQGVGERTRRSAFAAPFLLQLREATKRALLLRWREGPYLLSRMLLSVVVAVLIGLAFSPAATHQNHSTSAVFALLAALTALAAHQHHHLIHSTTTPHTSLSISLLAHALAELPPTALQAASLFAPFHYLTSSSATSTTSTTAAAATFALLLSALLLAAGFSATVLRIRTHAHAHALLWLAFTLLLLSGAAPAPAPTSSALPRLWQALQRANPLGWVAMGLFAAAGADAGVDVNERAAWQAVGVVWVFVGVGVCVCAVLGTGVWGKRRRRGGMAG